jgi:o-succinylbenzoate---CoA ligase
MANETIPNLITKRANLTPNRIAFIFEGQSVTYSELFEHTLSNAEKLVTLGMKKDDYVAVMLRNHIETVYILLALQLLGCRAILLNNRLSTHEIQWQLNNSNATVLITEEAYNSKYVGLEGNIILKSDLFEEKRTTFRLEEETNLNEICSIMYTSGTTGNPKGVLQTYGNHWWSATGAMLNLGLSDKDRWICAVPLFHISGYSILMRGIIYGMTVLLHEGFDEERILKDIVVNRASIVSVVTTMLVRLVERMENYTLPPSFRCMLVGGGPVPKVLLEASVEKKIPVYQTYGMTETASQVVTLTPEDSLIKLGSAGKPLFPVQLKIVSSDGNITEPMEAGEILIKAPNVTSGYLNSPSETNDKIKNGWLSTGDIGYLDEEGFLFVLDRRSDLIISGGENIYPAEVEGILLSHHQVIDAGVIGVKDAVWGQVPIAIIVKKAGASVTNLQLIEFCQNKLAKYKIPQKVVFVDVLPRNAAKKLMRHKLKEWWWENQIENQTN